MDYEKKYNEALKWMRELYPGLHGAIKEDAEHFFPELRESEDERIRQKLIWLLQQDICPFPEEEATKMIAYLEKQKEQKPVEWSEVDERIRKAILGFLNPDKGGTKYSSNAELVEWSDWLKSLRHHPSWKPTEKEITALENLMKGEFPDKIYPGTTLSELLMKLKKLYYNEAIPSWKPSEEQMNMLKCTLDYYGSHAPKELVSLYEDLKKL